MTLDLFYHFLNHVYLQKHLLAIKPRSVTEAVEAGSKYFQIKLGFTYGANVCQVDEDEALNQVRAAQTKPSEIELLLQVLQQLCSDIQIPNCSTS